MTFVDLRTVWIVGDGVREGAAMHGREAVGLQLERRDFCYTKCQSCPAFEERPAERSRIAHRPRPSASEQ